MRAIGVCALTLLTACGLSACGGGSPSPTAPPPVIPPPSPSLLPGRYQVILLAASAPDRFAPDCTPQVGPGVPVPLPVVRFRGLAEADGPGGLVIKPDEQFDLGLVFRLRGSSQLTGTLAGSLRDLNLHQVVVVIDGGAPDTPAEVSGLGPLGSGNLVGDLVGRMLFPGNIPASCKLGRWMMSPE